MDPASFTLDETIDHAVDLALRAHALGVDVGEWFAQVAARSEALLRARMQAADLPEGETVETLGPLAPGGALLKNRPASWEANLVRALIEGTASV